jgi:tRNA-dihydrouridine synthase 3
MLQHAGAAAVSIHGRTAEQRYKRPSDWSIIEEVARAVDIPVVGNGDLLTWYEAANRADGSACHAMMIGRGALIKPWIFEEIRQQRELRLTAEERVSEYRRFVSYMKEYFYDDDLGKRRAFYFLPWHFSFFSRYRPHPVEAYGRLGELGKPVISLRQGVVSEEVCCGWLKR